MLLIEGAQQSRQTGAAVESFRNVFAEAGNNMLSLMHGGGSSGGGVPLPRQIK
jgi:exopolysaccharide biosynthesis protein